MLLILQVLNMTNQQRNWSSLEKREGKRKVVTGEIKNKKKAAVTTDCPPSGRSRPMMRSWGFSTAV